MTYKVKDAKGNELKDCTTYAEANLYILYHYCTELLPNVSKFMSVDDIKTMIKKDRASLAIANYITDYMSIEEA